MVLRWIGTGLTKAGQQFRRVKGRRELPALIAALNVGSTSTKKVVA